VLVTQPTKEFITPADLPDREPEQAVGTLPILDALDLEHRTHLLSQGERPCSRPPRLP
jgi:hypothetical protein